MTPDHLRGRVMGIYVMSFLGLSPLGSLLAGTIANIISAPFAVAFGAAITAVATVVTLWLLPEKTMTAATA